MEKKYTKMYSLTVLAVTSLPLPPGGEQPVHSQLALLWYLRNPLFREQARLLG